MRSQPLFIVGSPRSGTTFLVNVLNQHPSIQITNETRIFVLLKDLIDVRSRHSWLLESHYQGRFAGFVRRHAGAWVEDFYRTELGVSAPIWGDKHPHYADPQLLEREARRIPGALSGSCLRLIKDCLPAAKFIHIHRDPRHVANSLMQKQWVKTLDEGVRVWRSHVEEIDGFFREIGEGSQHVVAYADIQGRPEAMVADMMRFLDLPEPTGIHEFLALQREQPTPFSSPVTDPGMPQRLALAGDIDARLLELAGPCARTLGYARAGRPQHA
jgi:hypothetical protein